MRLKMLAVVGLLLTAATFWWSVGRSPKVDFMTDIKPILNKKCMSCHGGVKRNGGFSLLSRQEALQPTESGKAAIVPGDPDASELIRRLTCLNPEERMPYKEDPLSAEEITLFRNWIKQGALWGDHWAYLPVQKPDLPASKTAWSFWGKTTDDIQWGNNDIDAFVLDRLKKAQLRPSPQADKATLLRRVALDLTGLPPTKALSDQFLADTTSGAYERLVDTLLASNTFGERWAAVWLDIARYADTKGYERDAQRTAWRYRDWVIGAFNKDMPYDQFLTEQIAGDMLPDPNNAQLVATQFHRNTPTNDEGGTDNEEFRTAAVLDRVATTWEGVMGTTFACVQCHSHPYDPFYHEEYYQFAAFFNNTRDADTYSDYPLIRWYEGKDSLQYLAVKDWLTQNTQPLEAAPMISLMRLWQPVWYSLECDNLQNCALLDTKWLGMSHQSSARLRAVNLDNKTRLITRYQCATPGGAVTVHLDRADGPVLTTIPMAKKAANWDFQKIDFPAVGGTHALFFTYENKALAKKPDDFGVQFDWFAFTTAFPGKDKPGHAETEQKWYDLLKIGCGTSPCMMENPVDYQRKSYVFERGNWLVPGNEVQPGTPKYLSPMPANAPKNRLGLAQWLTAPENPLTARVMVNRLWEQIFGMGLVETVEDFGTQGFEPSHPEMLDYLAWQFMHEHHWSTKSILRDMVLSATYQQSSRTSPELAAQDPNNRLLARGGRVRLSAEQIRDQALLLSGLLSYKMYGKPVMPYQPDGIWSTPWNNDAWVLSEGEDRYRRAIYTFWKRTSPYPSMMTFDGAGRQVCTARRVRTNTPLQALVTLNDPVFVECAKHFALRMKEEGGADLSSRIKKGYALATGKSISAEKAAIFEKLYAETLAKYQSKPEKVTTFLGDLPTEQQTAEIAALSVVGNAMLNLDEIVVKE